MQASTKATDDLLERHKRGDSSAFGELVATYAGPIDRYLWHAGVDAASRDDLRQEVYLRLHAAAARYLPDRPLRLWVFTIVANTVRSYFRKLTVQRRVFAPALFEGDSGTPPSDAVAAAKQELHYLAEALARLPLLQREVVILTCVQGLEQREAALVLGIPLNTVKTYLRRARLSLAKALAKRRQRQGGAL